MFLFLVVLLFLLFLQLKTPEGFKIWKESRGTDYWGNDLSHSITTLRECKRRCIRNPSCKVISTNYDGAAPRPALQGHCWVKSDYSQGTPNNNQYSYILSRS